jgi:hypothetical protein
MFNKADKYFWIANVVITLSLVLFLSRSLFTNRILAPADFKTYPFFVPHIPAAEKPGRLLYDPIVQYFPWFHFDKQIFKTGKLPLWNPYQGCGAPHVANMQSSIFYPLNMFVFALNWKWGVFFLYFFKLYFVGLFLYLYLKEIGISPPVSIVFSVAGMYTSFNTILLYFPTTTGAFFFPLGLWAIELIVHSVREPYSVTGSSDGGIKPLKSAALSNAAKTPKQFKAYLILCLGFVFALFGGNPEVVFYSTFTLIIYLIVRLFQTYRLNLYKQYLPVLIKFFVVLIIGILIASIQLLPFLEYLRLSSAYLARNVLDLPLNNLPAYLLLFNILPPLPLHPGVTALSSVFDKYHTIIIFAYAGVSVLLLGITGIIALSKDKIVRVFTLISGIALCIGFYIPYVNTVITKVPGFDIGRNYYMLIFIGWALVIISSKALDNFIAAHIKFRDLKIAAVVIAGLILVLGFWFIRYTYPSLSDPIQKAITYSLLFSIATAIIIVILTLWILKIKNIKLLIILLGVFIYVQTALPMIFAEPAIRPEYFYPKNKIFSILRKEQGTPFRVTAFLGNNQPIAYATNINTFYNLEDIRNYDSLGVNWYNSIFPYVRLSDALNLTNVVYLIEGKDFDLSSLSNNLQPIADYNGYTLYKNISAFNRAFMVYHYLIADDQQQTLDLLKAYSGQLKNTAIVFRKDIQAMPLTMNTQGTYTIDFTKYSPESITISCTTSHPGLFFISNTYFPGWHATVDGESTKVLRVDYAFQGLWLTQGSHTIELKYAPSSFKYGVLLSIIGIISLIGFYIIVFRKKEYYIKEKK